MYDTVAYRSGGLDVGRRPEDQDSDDVRILFACYPVYFYCQEFWSVRSLDLPARAKYDLSPFPKLQPHVRHIIVILEFNQGRGMTAR